MNSRLFFILTFIVLIIIAFSFLRPEAKLDTLKSKSINETIQNIESERFKSLVEEYKKLNDFDKKNLETKFLIKLDIIAKNDINENLEVYRNLHALDRNNIEYEKQTNYYKYLSMSKKDCTRLSSDDKKYILEVIKAYTIEKVLTDTLSYEFFSLGSIFESSQKIIDTFRYYFSTSFVIRGNSDLTYSKNIGGNIYLDKICRPIKIDYYLDEKIRSFDIEYYDK